MSENNIKETIESAKEEISSISWRIQELRDDLDSLLRMMDREERDESEELFGMLVNAGFNVGTKFRTSDSPTVWTITGICKEGFVVECDRENGEHKKEYLRTYNKRYVDSYISNLKIVNGDEVNNA